MKAICFLANQKYYELLKTCIFSVQENNAFENIVILSDGLSDWQKDWIENQAENVEFVEVDRSRYNEVNKTNLYSEYLARAYYKLEVFRLRGYDKVIMMDVDMVNLKPFKDIFELPGKIYMSKQGYDSFNTGFVLIDGSMLTDQVYDGVLNSLSNAYILADQDLLNDYFRGLIAELPKKYNTFSGDLINTDTVNVHYLGVKKPHEFRCMNYELWQSYHDKIDRK